MQRCSYECSTRTLTVSSVGLLRPRECVTRHSQLPSTTGANLPVQALKGSADEAAPVQSLVDGLGLLVQVDELLEQGGVDLAGGGVRLVGGLDRHGARDVVDSEVAEREERQQPGAAHVGQHGVLD